MGERISQASVVDGELGAEDRGEDPQGQGGCLPGKVDLALGGQKQFCLAETRHFFIGQPPRSHTAAGTNFASHAADPDLVL